MVTARRTRAACSGGTGRDAGARQEPEEDAEGCDHTWGHAATRLGPSGRPWAEICSRCCEGSVRARMCERRHCAGCGDREHTQYHPAPQPCPRGAPVMLATAGFSYICFIWWNCLCTDYTPKCSQHTASNIWQRAAAKQCVAGPSRGHRRGAVGWKEVRWKAPNIAGSLVTPQQETGQRSRASLTERW